MAAAADAADATAQHIDGYIVNIQTARECFL